nr:hypothetical protein [Tanacetum cinerariifolium]
LTEPDALIGTGEGATLSHGEAAYPVRYGEAAYPVRLLKWSVQATNSRS